MKFAQQLRQGAVEEWRRAYVDYRLLKKLIKAAKKSEEDHDDPDAGTEDSSQPLNVPTDYVSPASSGFATRDGSSSEDVDNSGVAGGRSRPQTRHTTTSRMTRIQSRSSARSEQATRAPGLRNRKKSSAQSFKEARWRYPPDLTLDELMDVLNPQERRFFTILDAELEKVESFYEEREAEAMARYKVLREQLDQLAEHRAAYLASHSKAAKGEIPIGKTAIDAHPAESHIRQESDSKSRQGVSGLAGRAVRPVSSYLPFYHEAEGYVAARRKLKLAVFEYYKYLGYVKNYRLLNRTGFSKSTKKMEKVTKIKCQEAYMHKVHMSHFSNSAVIDDLQSQTETMFGASFEKGSRKKAVQRLRFAGAATRSHHFAAWRSGILLGLAIPALIDGLVKATSAETQRRMPTAPSLLQLYGALFLPVLLAFGIALNLVGWHNAHINVPLVFYFDTRTNIDFRKFMEMPTLLLCTLCYCFWLSFNVVSNTISPQVWPLVWLFGFFLWMFNPLPIMYVRARWWLIRSTFRVFTAGLVRVEFRDFYLGDQFASLYYTAYNLGFLVCLYTHHWAPDVNSVCSTNETWASPVLASLPYWWRLGQSIRRYHDSPEVKTHLVNAGKYAAGVLYFFMYFNWRINGSGYDARFAIYIVFAAINSSYSSIWDLLMDWNLFKRGSKHRFLRNELAYHNQKWFYYFAIVTNFILRFSWFIYLFPQGNLRLKGFIVSLFETIRRFQWNFIRVESEHVGNVDGFRVTRDVPLPYTLPGSASHLPEAPGAVDIGDDDAEDADAGEAFRQEKDGEGTELAAKRNVFSNVLPGLVAQRLKSVIKGKALAPDESDDEEDSPASDNNQHTHHHHGAARHRHVSTTTSNALTQVEEDMDNDHAHVVKDQRHRGYNTFGWDSDVENVRAPEQAHATGR